MADFAFVAHETTTRGRAHNLLEIREFKVGLEQMLSLLDCVTTSPALQPIHWM